jgi:hypothetical protein
MRLALVQGKFTAVGRLLGASHLRITATCTDGDTQADG